jgi:hypothetical protein
MRLLFILVLVAMIAACGGEDPPSTSADAGSEDAGPTPYPSGPFGFEVGETVPNIYLNGYPGEWEPRYNAGWQSIALSDYYDPDGNRGPDGNPLQILLVDISTTNCHACMLEAEALENFCENIAKGLLCYTAMKSDRAYLEDWKENYHVTAPIVLHDPLQWPTPGGHPTTYVIDLSTMKVLEDFNSSYSFVNESDIQAMLKKYLGWDDP